MYLKLTKYFLSHDYSAFMQPVLETIGHQVYQHPMEVPIIDLAKSLLELLDKQCITYLKQFAEMFKSILTTLSSSGYTSDNAFLVFDGMGILAALSCHQQDNQALLETLWLDLLSQVFQKASSDLVSFVLQLLAIMVSKCQGRVLQGHYTSILTNLLQPNNWDPTNCALFPSQTIFIESVIRHSPDLLPSLLPQLTMVCQ